MNEFVIVALVCALAVLVALAIVGAWHVWQGHIEWMDIREAWFIEIEKVGRCEKCGESFCDDCPVPVCCSCESFD